MHIASCMAKPSHWRFKGLFAAASIVACGQDTSAPISHADTARPTSASYQLLTEVARIDVTPPMFAAAFVSSDGLTERVIAKDSLPFAHVAISPDGAHLAFDRMVEGIRMGVIVSRADGTEARVITPPTLD